MGDLRKRLLEGKLWLVLDAAAAAPRSLPEVTKQAIAGGVDVIVFRHRDRPVAEVADVGGKVRSICRANQVPFVLSHYPELVGELVPDALQLSVNEPYDGAGQPHGMLLGASTHSLAEAKLKYSEGYDYVMLGPVFATPSKMQFGEPLGLEVVEGSTAQSQLPVVFVGGINSNNVMALCDAGAQRVAVLSAIQAQADPRAAAADLRALL